MKYVLSFLIFSLIGILRADAQAIGPGMEYSYTNGYRVKREYNANAVLNKPGKNGKEQADTIIGVQKEHPNARPEDSKQFVRAYPNPVHDILFIENLQQMPGSYAEIRLFDVSGKQILTKVMDMYKDKIQVGDIPPGNYNVSYYLNGQYLISWKIIKL